MKKFLSVLMAATMLVGVMALTGCGGDTTEPTTDEANNQSEPASTTATDLKTVTEGVLTMSTNAAFPPYESTDDSGNVVGIDADIAAAIAEKLGLKLQIDDMDFDGALAAAQSGAVNATALAKKYAEVNGVDLSAVSGTGHDGKIRKNDVLNAAAPAQREITRIPLTPIRKAIARNMFNSLHSMAQTSDSVEIDVTELMALRQRLLAHKDELGTKITINDLLSYAAVKMIKAHPLANASFSDTEILCYPDVNLSMAVATDYGLTSPVVHGADRMSLVELSLAMRDLVVRARDRKLTVDDQQGGTFTLTNMGIFPVDNFNPILPAPQSCIIGFGRCVEKPAVYQGQICIRTMMVLSVTYDHRVFDGGEVGSIMKTMKEYLETPELFLVQ